MDNKKLLNLLDTIPKIQSDKLASLYGELISILDTEAEKFNSKSIDGTQFQNLAKFILKILLSGTTSTNPSEQTRYLALIELILSHQQVATHLDYSQLTGMMDGIIHPKNSVSKGEKIFLQNSYTQNLIILLTCFIGFENSDSKKTEEIEQVVGILKSNIILKDNYVYFTAGNITKLLQIIEGIEKLECQQKQHKYLLSKSRYAQTLKLLVDRLVSVEIKDSGYKSAYFWLSLFQAGQYLEKTKLAQVDQKTMNLLSEKAKSILNKQSLQKIWLEIVKDDHCNTKLVIPFYNIVSQITSLNITVFYPIILSFFHSSLKSIEKNKEQIQKKSMHFCLFLGSLISGLGYRTFTGIEGIVATMKLASEKNVQELGESGNKLDNLKNAASSSPLASSLIDSIQFWLKQYNQKAQLSKDASLKVESALVEALDTSNIPSTVPNHQQIIQQIQNIQFYMLLLAKTSPGMSLSRQNKFGLSSMLYSGIYFNQQNFATYFKFLKRKVVSATKISNVNFYLDELMALGQAGITVKKLKGLTSAEAAGVVKQRVKIIELFSSMLTKCDKESIGPEGSILQNVNFEEEDKFTIKKFANHLFQRILDTIFKRDDKLFLSQAAETYSKILSEKTGQEHSQAFAEYQKLLEESKTKLKSSATVDPAHLSLLDALTLQNPYTDDVLRNREIVQDLLTAIQQLSSEKPVKKLKTSTVQNAPQPIEVFVDSIIALVSTNHPQIKYILQEAYEASLSNITPDSIGLILDAITRTDMEYIKDEGEEAGESSDGEDEEELEDGSEMAEEMDSEDANSDDEASDQDSRNPATSLTKKKQLHQLIPLLSPQCNHVDYSLFSKFQDAQTLMKAEGLCDS